AAISLVGPDRSRRCDGAVAARPRIAVGDVRIVHVLVDWRRRAAVGQLGGQGAVRPERRPYQRAGGLYGNWNCRRLPARGEALEKPRELSPGKDWCVADRGDPRPLGDSGAGPL